MSLPIASICLDVQGAQSHSHHDRGIARFIVEHARAIHAQRRQALHSVLLNPGLPLTGNLDWLLGDRLLGWTTSDRRVSPRVSSTPAIYHVMSPFELQHTIGELWPGWARQSDVRTAVTLYDTVPVIFPEHYLRDPVIKTRYEARAELVRTADAVLAISQTTADDAVERLGVDPDRVKVIDAGATAKFATMYRSREAAWDVVRARLGTIRPGFMLYVAGFEFRKNLERVVAAYGLMPEAVRSQHQLVIACRMLPSEKQLVTDWARSAGVKEGQLVVTGYVSDAELGALYHTCSLFLFASIYEGSGLPILEAMSCGAPVAASSTSTTPEILGDMRATFDPYEPREIADCLSSTIESKSELAALRKRSADRVGRYTWSRVADRSLTAYEGMLAARPQASETNRRRRRRRIALVSPWPPEQSGIADYNLRLARELGRNVDVDVIVANDLDHYAPPLERGVTLASSRSFRAWETLRQPDRILYCMGNSAFHGHVYELLRERPGAVVAHDVRLTGFYGWFAGVEAPADPAARLQERIAAMYGPRLPPETIREGSPSWQRQHALGIFMTGEIQEYAEQLFVHSRHAREVLELDRPAIGRQTPIELLPFGMPPAISEDRAIREVAAAPLIVSVGVVSEVKGLAELIAAVSLVGEHRAGVRLVIAGPGDDAELERWRALARESAPAIDVELTGHLPMERYTHLLATADLAVQLRTLSNGEASAAVADCLSAGLPTVVTDAGWAGELPEDIVAKVPADCTGGELAEHLERLLEDGDLRRDISDGARSFASAHSFARVADAYAQALELA
jgi:glycosyltransferase involved in cell wall biosynthesis